MFEKLYKLSQDMHDQLVAKDRKIAAKERENEELQEQFDARGPVIKDISEVAKKNREACDKIHRKNVKSEKAQRMLSVQSVNFGGRQSLSRPLRIGR